MAKKTREKSIKIGERLRLVRVDILKISSQHDLAKEMGVSQSTITCYENGVMEIGTEFLAKLHALHKVMPNYITIGKLPIIEGKDSSKALITDITEMKSQILALIAQVNYLASRGK